VNKSTILICHKKYQNNNKKIRKDRYLSLPLKTQKIPFPEYHSEKQTNKQTQQCSSKGKIAHIISYHIISSWWINSFGDYVDNKTKAKAKKGCIPFNECSFCVDIYLYYMTIVLFSVIQFGLICVFLVSHVRLFFFNIFSFQQPFFWTKDPIRTQN
jgi:hypothetical protein